MNVWVVMRKNSGFSLIELVIVIAIIATLTMIALPILSNNKERAAIIESLNLVGNTKSSIENDINLSRDISQQDYAAPLGISVVNSSSSGASIDINLSQTAHRYFSNPNDIIRLTGSISGSSFAWTCSHNINASSLTIKNVPTICKSTFNA